MTQELVRLDTTTLDKMIDECGRIDCVFKDGVTYCVSPESKKPKAIAPIKSKRSRRRDRHNSNIKH